MLKVSRDPTQYLDDIVNRRNDSEVVLYWVRLDQNRITDVMRTVHIAYEQPFHILIHDNVKHAYADKIHLALADNWYMVSWESDAVIAVDTIVKLT